ncbi:MAG: hypothetical protein JST16_16260 [Bdellovibrionales bacterium]|nr:hypothetical protein [Bdellovibrionales bacterium]
MKNLKLVLAASVALGAMSSRAAQVAPNAETLAASMKVAARVLAVAANRINWQTGEYHNLTVSLEGMGDIGTMHTEVMEDVPAENAFWYQQVMSLMGQDQTTRSLISRADGHEIRRIVNGKEETISTDDNKIDVLEESETSLTVPAGTFDCLYIKAKITTKDQSQEVEMWVNPRDVNLDGMLKMTMQTQFGPMSITLNEFGPKH